MTNTPNEPKKQSGLVLRPLNPQEVQLRPAPVWSKALAWTIIACTSANRGADNVARGVAGSWAHHEHAC